MAGIEGLVDREQWVKKTSVTDPHFVDQDKIQLVTTEESSLEENSLFDSKDFDSLVATIRDEEMPTREMTADLKRL